MRNEGYHDRRGERVFHIERGPAPCIRPRVSGGGGAVGTFGQKSASDMTSYCCGAHWIGRTTSSFTLIFFQASFLNKKLNISGKRVNLAIWVRTYLQLTILWGLIHFYRCSDFSESKWVHSRVPHLKDESTHTNCDHENCSADICTMPRCAERFLISDLFFVFLDQFSAQFSLSVCLLLAGAGSVSELTPHPPLGVDKLIQMSPRKKEFRPRLTEDFSVMVRSPRAR